MAAGTLAPVESLEDLLQDEAACQFDRHADWDLECRHTITHALRVGCTGRPALMVCTPVALHAHRMQVVHAACGHCGECTHKCWAIRPA